MIKAVLLVSIGLSLIFVGSFFQHNLLIYPQSENIDVVKNDTWISKQNNLNVTISLDPKVPVIDEKTDISFELRTLNDSRPFENLSGRVTLTDHDGRLYKFNDRNMPVSDGKLSVVYIFPDDGEHRVILQLYKNESAFSISSFDIAIPHPKQPPSPIDSFFGGLFDNLL
jgi:hypothetical protein